MNSVERFGRMVKAVFTDPKSLAQLEWHREYGIRFEGWPEDEMRTYAATGQHPNPDRRVRVVIHEIPDFDWWEPRYDQPGRREQSRYRELGVL